jgi:DNA repair protein RecN (Recombination protein N)
MIETLRIENLAIVSGAELEFGPGLNVITGETGAGKSIVLGALALLAGGRASPDLVREGEEEAAVEAVFRVAALPELAAELERRGLAAGEELVVRRTIARSGRGRARIGGELVPAATLAELFQGRLEISSQHESQRLLRPGAQSRLLDAAGGLLGERAALEAAFERLRAVDRETGELRARAEELSRREDYLKFQVKEIDEAKVEAGQFETLLAERGRLAHAGRLIGDAGAAAALLSGEGAGADAPGALDQLADAARRVDALASLDPGLGELAERLRGARAELDDAARELARYAESIEVDPARLAEVEERLARLERLRRKYGPDEAAILRFRDGAAGELEALGGADARLGQLERERRLAHEQLAVLARRLSEARAGAAEHLAGEVEAHLRELAMPEGRFQVALVPADTPDGMPCGPGGAESAEFLFSANAGESPQALRRVVSGGELSRVFLAVKSALRRAEAGMVLVFDEVDAGIGGRVADRVGRVLAELAGEHQVLCITHLPQIAARGAVHLRVDKRAVGERTLAAVTRLEGRARVDEIARMAGGETVGKATLRHAQELLRSRRP